MKATRTQWDDLGDKASEVTGLACDPTTDTARQDKKEESDVNTLLQRFGVGVPQKRTTFEDVDYDLDLQQAYAAAASAQDVWAKQSPAIRQKYPTWQKLINAAATGDFEEDLRKEEAKKEEAKKIVPPDSAQPIVPNP